MVVTDDNTQPGSPRSSAPTHLPVYRGRAPGAYRPGSSWKTWLRLFSNFLTLQKVTVESDQRLIFLQEIGDSNYELLESLLQGRTLEDTPNTELYSVMEKHFAPKKLVLAERYRLMTMAQNSGQTLQDFYASIQKTAKDCDFGAIKDHRDAQVTLVFIGGISSLETRKRLFEKEDLTSKQALEIAEAFERVGQNAPHLKEGSHPTGIGKIFAKKSDRSVHSKGKWEPKSFKSTKKHDSHKPKHGHGTNCTVCGMKGHSSERCFHKEGAFCGNCRKSGHLARACRKQAKVSRHVNSCAVFIY